MKRLFIISAPFLILAVFFGVSINSMKHSCPVYDEVSHHIGSGYSFLKTRDFRLNSTQPPLIEEIAALPLLFLKPTLPTDHPSWQAIDRSSFNFQFLYRYGNDANAIVFWARFMIVILSMLCGIVVFIWAKELYGYRAGVLALFLYAFSPNIIAYSQIVTADLGVSFFMLLASYRFYKFLAKPKIRNIIFAGIALGLAQASKLTAFILIPLFFVFAIWRWKKTNDNRCVAGVFAIYAICYSVVFACYLGEIKPLLKNDIDIAEKVGYIEKAVDKFFHGNDPLKKNLISFALNAPIPFSTYIMNILSSANMIFKQNIFEIYLFGETSMKGWWYYYPIVFLLKTPLPVLILLFLALFYYKRLKLSNRLSEAVLLSFLILFSLTCLFSKLQGGVRYILPIYPFLFIYISKITAVKMNKKIFLNLTIAALSIWYITETILYYPYYISYFNQLAGGAENGWRYLRGSNIDFGQDLPSLSSYMERNGINEVRLSYCGTADPAYYGIRCKQFAKEDYIRPKHVVYAVSVSCIDSVKWAKGIRPTEKASYSIFIYDFRKKGTRAK